MATPDTAIWRQDPISLAWKLVRRCAPTAAHQWLLSAKQDDPEATFKISPTRPKS